MKHNTTKVTNVIGQYSGVSFEKRFFPNGKEFSFRVYFAIIYDHASENNASCFLFGSLRKRNLFLRQAVEDFVIDSNLITYTFAYEKKLREISKSSEAFLYWRNSAIETFGSNPEVFVSIQASTKFRRGVNELLVKNVEIHNPSLWEDSSLG